MGKRDREDDHDSKTRKKSKIDTNDDLQKQLAELNEKVERKKQKTGVSEFITEDDYFKKNAEFRIWLLQSKKKYFDELSSKKCRYYFAKFVKKWNEYVGLLLLTYSGKLSSDFYKRGIHSSSLTAQDRTSYRWKFTNVDNFELDTVRDAVDTDSWDKSWSDVQNTRSSTKTQHADSDDENQKTLDREYERKKSKLEEKKFKKRKESDLEELVPKADPGSRQAKLEKKRASHARKDDFDDEYGVDDDFMGGDFDAEKEKFRKQMESQQRYKEKRQEELQKKVEAYKEKEAATMAAFKEQMGLSSRFNVSK